MTIKTEKELAAAIENKEEYIEIEGDLTNKVIKIKATGNVSWAIAIGAIGVAVTALLLTAGTGGTAAPVTSGFVAVSSFAAVSVLGLSTTTAAVSIAVAAGGVGALNKLRGYKISEKNSDKIVLKRG